MNSLLLEEFRLYGLLVINIPSTKQILREDLKEYIQVHISQRQVGHLESGSMVWDEGKRVPKYLSLFLSLVSSHC